MEDRAKVASAQLARMRGMTAMYHRRFFFDINTTSVLVIALLLAGWWEIPEAFLLVPVVALIGAVQTAFDASYLIFARSYAVRLETFLNDELGTKVLVASEMEATYLFPLATRKIVTIPLSGGISWFSFMTLFYTLMGVAAFGFGLTLGWETLNDAPQALAITYLATVFGLGAAALLVGLWWFVGGEGERRLATVLDRAFSPNS